MKKIDKEPRMQACLMIYHLTHSGESDNEIGRTFELIQSKQGILIGNQEDVDIQVAPDGPLPIRARLYQDKNQIWYMENLEGHNNIFVNHVLSRARVLNDGDLIRMGKITFRFLDGKGHESTFHYGLQRVIGIDILTGISNRRQINNELLRAMAYCTRSNRPFCLVLIDIDNFSAINNKYGHSSGDFILREIVSRIQKNIRTEDIFGRYGGEEFLLGLPNLSKEQAFSFLERVRKKVTRDPIEIKGKEIKVTFSAGLANSDGTADLHVIREQADKLMYLAKSRGKNQIAIKE